MLDAAGHDGHLAFAKLDNSVAILDAKASAPDQKHLLDFVMTMPRKDALDLHELHLLTVEARDRLGPPGLVEEGKFFRQRNFFHCTAPKAILHASAASHARAATPLLGMRLASDAMVRAMRD